MLNWSLMKEPYNWIIILLMVLTANIGVRYIVTAANAVK